MRTYIIRRVIAIIPTLFIASLIVFFLIRLIPGDIIDQMVREHEYVSDVSRQMTRDVIMHELGLDVPLYVQYGRWLGDIFLHGSLGASLWSKTTIVEEILVRWPVTVELGLMALVVAFCIALPIGTYSAIRQDTAGDYLGRSLAILFVAIPNFWLATMVMVFPALWWNWSPPMMLIKFTDNPLGNLQMFIVPALVLGVAMAGVTMRMTRTMMLEVLRQDYIRTAWAKGLRERVVVSRHVLKNALIPVITIVGLQLPVMIGGTVIIEQIFVLPGVGRLMLTAINTRDYPIVSGVMVFVGTGVLLINLLVDLSYAFLDPRIHYR
ncbi:MAG: ABC transporter permease [Dehalococcoidales bacterium]|nr:ABC transporter permease [Dehalococcoidales bacterium]